MQRVSRFSFGFILVASLSVPSFAATPLSTDLVAQGQVAFVANKPSEALDLFEAASLADPKNAAAFAGMARSYAALGLQGKSLRYYREALELAPNDVTLLEAQALGMIAKGNVSKAEAAFDRIKKICAKTACPAKARVDAALAKARPQTSLNAVRVPGILRAKTQTPAVSAPAKKAAAPRK
jgi:tetratricopeptide (TPR) repeat protein